MKKPKDTTAVGINWSKVDDATAAAIASDEATKLVIIEDNTKLIQSEIGHGIMHALEKVGLLAERFAKENLTRNRSVDTGRLRNSVTHAIDGDRKVVYIGTNVHYAPYVELGTSRAKEKPYLRPAASEHENEYKQAFESELKDK